MNTYSVHDPRAVVAQAVADWESISIERAGGHVGFYVRCGAAGAWWFRTEDAARVVFGALLAARRQEGRVVTEALAGDTAESFRARHDAALAEVTRG